jgi:predicted nucleic acid-binding Zn ribbon protein
VKARALVPTQHRRIPVDRARVRITADSLVSCPTTGQKVERSSSVHPTLRATGFYSTDHRKPKAKEQPKGGGDE